MNFYKDKEIRYHHRHFHNEGGHHHHQDPLMITTMRLMNTRKAFRQKQML